MTRGQMITFASAGLVVGLIAGLAHLRAPDRAELRAPDGEDVARDPAPPPPLPAQAIAVPRRRPEAPAPTPAPSAPMGGTASGNTSPISNRDLGVRWLNAVATYNAPDRGDVLNDLEHALAARGAGMVRFLSQDMAELSVYRTTERSAVLHALGAVGRGLVESREAPDEAAVRAIQEIAKKEIELPDWVPPDPELHLETLAAGERDALIHMGRLDKQDGRLVQPTLPNKLAAVQTLIALGNEGALAQLNGLEGGNKSVPGLEFAIHRAIVLLTNSNRKEP